MKSVNLKYSRNQVNKAGDILRTPQCSDADRKWADEVLGNWRAVHNYPINTFQATLRQKLSGIDEKALVAQRLKRIPSIIEKMKRFPQMQLARMQDIGGLRAVIRNIKAVNSLYKNYKGTHFQHKLFSEKNYILKPKPSGYRGIHLIYSHYNKRVPGYDKLFLELQIRTRQQHAWATAVETMDVFLKSALKSSEGPKEWKNFFSLTGSAFAHLEKQNPVPGYEHLDSMDTYRAVTKKSKQLKIHDKLSEFGKAIELISDKRKGSYYLLILDSIEKRLEFTTYSKDRFDIATNEYLSAEKTHEGVSHKQIVLVSTESVDALKRAYPNYFLNTKEFLKTLKKIETKANE